jgi:CheY-like chemotaxis protein
MPNVLVVEDEKIAQKVAELLLKSYNLDVDIVDTGEKALDAIGQKEYHLILMDFGLPGGEKGYEVARKIKFQIPSFATPIIGLTAHLQKDELQKAINGGMAECLPKPLTAETVHYLCATYLR